MGDVLPIKYSGFWDFPHAFWVCYAGESYLFWRGYFDEEVDDYPDTYEVFRATGIRLDDEALPWELSEIPVKTKIGVVKIRDVKFDPSHRKYIESSIFTEILA